MEEKIPFSRLDEKDFVDLPGTKPSVKFPLEKVGITNRNHYLKVIDPFTKKEVELFADVKVFLNLPSNQRGLHMARIEQGLHKMKSGKPLPLKEYVMKLCKDVQESQEQENSYVEIVAKYEKLVSKNISKRPGHELIDLHIIGELRDKSMNFKIGVSVPFINACPCAQRWGMREFYKSLKSDGMKDEEIEKIVSKAPLQAHTNKGDAKIIIHSDEVDFSEVYGILEESSPLTRELLSGEDEHVVVREAHKKRMFCEDVVREIVKNIVKKLDGKINSKTIIEVIVEVDESIHFHNLYAEVKDTLENLKKNLS